MYPTSAPGITKILAPLVLIATLASDSIGSTSLPYIEVNDRKRCADIPASVIDQCQKHKGSSTPFSYAVIRSFEDCDAIADSSRMHACRLRPLGTSFHVSTSHLNPNIQLVRDSADAEAGNAKYRRNASTIAGAYAAVGVLLLVGMLASGFLYYASLGLLDP